MSDDLAVGLFNWSNVKDWMLSVSGHGLGYETQTIATPPAAKARVSVLAERDAALAEVTRLREALGVAREDLECPGLPRVMDALGVIDVALAEGSDVLPTQRDH